MEEIFKNLCTPATPLPDLERVIQFLGTHPHIARLNIETQQKDWRTQSE